MKFFIIILLICSFSYGDSIKYEKSLNIVTDSKNKRMWQDNNDVKQYLETFTTAKVYCDILILNGYIDWRVPTIKEIQDIVDVTQKNSIKKSFKFLQANIYTTNTVFTNDDMSLLAIDFTSGKTVIVQKSEEHYIRCVRDIK